MKSEFLILISLVLITSGHINQHPGFSISISTTDTSAYPKSKEIETKISTPPVNFGTFPHF
jgi:hypothetical protein